MQKLTLFFLIPLLGIISCKEENDTAPVGTGSTSGAVKPDVVIAFKTATDNILHNHRKTLFEVESNVELSKVEFFFNDKPIGSTTTKPYAIEFTPLAFPTGEYDLSAIATLNNKEYKPSKKVSLELSKGDKFQGGSIFYLSPDKLHGLIAADTDYKDAQTDRYHWGPTRLIGATNMDDGQPNTAEIIKAVKPNESFNYWRDLKNYKLNDYKDWYVPSYNELTTLRENQQYATDISPKSEEANYWSSTEISATKAYARNLVATMGEQVDKVSTYKIRLIRKF